MIHTQETKDKLSSMRKGANNPFFGRKHSEETKAKMRLWTRNMNAKRQYDIEDISIKIPSITDLAYIAGIIDGEGSISFKKDRPVISIYNTCDLLMDWLKINVGGVVRNHSRGRVWCKEWYISSARDVYGLSTAIYGFLVIKRDRCEKVITFLKNKYGAKL